MPQMRQVQKITTRINKLNLALKKNQTRHQARRLQAPRQSHQTLLPLHPAAPHLDHPARLLLHRAVHHWVRLLLHRAVHHQPPNLHLLHQAARKKQAHHLLHQQSLTAESAAKDYAENLSEQSANDDSALENVASEEEESPTEEAIVNKDAESNESDDDIQEANVDVKQQDDTAEDANQVDDSIMHEAQGEQTTEELSEDNLEFANEDDSEQLLEKEAEIARLSAEVERLRSSMAGAADVIEELENPPMPPVVTEDIVIGAHIVSDIARIARQLDRDELIRASMGTIAMLHPDHLDILVASKHWHCYQE